jgi:hypothetical protein
MKQSPVLLNRYACTAVLFLLATLAFALAASAACENILVSGAGYAPANGTYVRGGDSYGKPTYDLGGAYRISWMGMWYLADYVGGTYYHNDSSANEPPSSGWVSLLPAYNPAPTLSCADPAPASEQPAPEPKIVGRSYELQDGSLTLTYENAGNASATVVRLYAGPTLMAPSAEGATSFWIPDSDLWQVIPLDQTYIVEPGATLTLVLPSIQLPQGWLEQAAARSAVFTGFTFSAPHIAVSVSGSAVSWIHLVPAWLEEVQAGG